jgi:hypothetical protein
MRVDRRRHGRQTGIMRLIRRAAGEGPVSFAEILRKLYAGVTVGDRLGEAFYAVWMAVVSIGLINSVSVITADHVLWVVGVCFSVNLTWGIIDGVTVMYSNVIERAERDRALHDLRSGRDGATGEVRRLIDDSIAGALGEANKDKLAAALADGDPGVDPRTRRYGPGRDDWLYAVGIVLIDVGLVVPVVTPLFVIGDIAMAIYMSRMAAVLIFAALGWAYAKRVNHNPWPAAAFLGVLGFAVFTGAYEAGW